MLPPSHFSSLVPIDVGQSGAQYHGIAICVVVVGAKIHGPHPVQNHCEHASVQPPAKVLHSKVQQDIDVVLVVVILHFGQEMQNLSLQACAHPPATEPHARVTHSPIADVVVSTSLTNIVEAAVDLEVVMVLVVVTVPVLVLVGVKGHGLHDLQNHCWHALTQPPEKATHC